MWSHGKREAVKSSESSTYPILTQMREEDGDLANPLQYQPLAPGQDLVDAVHPGSIPGDVSGNPADMESNLNLRVWQQEEQIRELTGGELAHCGVAE